jgi:two-component system phosphate regulon response regulator OmpR
MIELQQSYGVVTMAERAHILVVDDEPEIRDMLQEYLELQGFRVSAADGGEAARRLVAEEDIDLALLDIAMPGEDGLSIARFLRERTSISIVMLTAAGDVTDRVVGLEVGADDYLAKPVDLGELVARLKAVLRRSKPEAVDEPPPSGVAANAVPFGTCHLDVDAHRLFDAQGEEIPITSMEFDLLAVFIRNPDRVLSRDQLFNLTQDKDWDPDDRSIDLRIGRIRRKIERDPKKPELIKTVHSLGYVYSAKKA